MTSPAPTSPAPTTAADTAGGSPDGSITATVETASAGAVVTTKLTIGTIEPEAAAAVQIGLGAAHAAVWSYGLISAYDPDNSSVIRDDQLAYITLRDTTTDLLRSVGVDPVRTEAAYQVPVVVTDAASARLLAALVEKDVTNAWRAVIGSTDNYELRKFALLALSAAAVRLTRWRTLAGFTPTTVPFPGNEAS